tara:strand:- start:561 stop:1376 length:816 start_codon:yes stop_codon:yes gene_type:complete
MTTMASTVTIFKPVGGSHCGVDTSRELYDLWVENKLCTIKDSPDDYAWFEEPGRILLYDYPRLDDRPIPKFKYGLFGNTVPKHERCFPWTFWARKPRLLERQREKKLLSFDERDVESVFLGKIENEIQYSNRTVQDWSTANLELFICPVAAPGPQHHKYTQEQYLDIIFRSKFGLCLPGYGPKCNREIELLGAGVVPIFTPGVDNTYHDPLVDGTHFISVENPIQVKERINSISKQQWEDMHAAGQSWYNKNASTTGSFNTTVEIATPLIK